jgi:hypothetical protein
MLELSRKLRIRLNVKWNRSNDDMYGADFFLIGFNIVKISQLKNLKSDRHETLNILQLQTLKTEQVEGL